MKKEHKINKPYQVLCLQNEFMTSECLKHIAHTSQKIAFHGTTIFKRTPNAKANNYSKIANQNDCIDCIQLYGHVMNNYLCVENKNKKISITTMKLFAKCGTNTD
jgi:hypothetical protein